MAHKFNNEVRQIIKAWLNKVQNVKFHYYYKSKGTGNGTTANR